MCNGWNHPDGCECGFGPPYDRDVPEFFDQRVGSEGGKDLSAIGPQSERLGSIVGDDRLTTQLVSTFLWQSYIGRPATELIGRIGKGSSPEAPIVYIVRHGTGQPRHDLLIFDPQIPPDQVEQGYVDVTSADLRAGWRDFRKAYGLTESSVPPWLHKLALQDIPEIALEAMSAQRHFFIAMHPPKVVWTSSTAQTFPRIPTSAVSVSIKLNGKGVSTAGVVSIDDKGRKGVTTALHAVANKGKEVFVKGTQGNIRSKDSTTDSCFIEIEDPDLLPCATCLGPLTGVTPGRGEDVWFDGTASGVTHTHVDGWTHELPWTVPGVQSRIITPPVTQGGDSGAALVNKNGNVVGFAFYRTGFNSKSPHSAWMWAESVFEALRLK